MSFASKPPATTFRTQGGLATQIMAWVGGPMQWLGGALAAYLAALGGAWSEGGLLVCWLGRVRAPIYMWGPGGSGYLVGAWGALWLHILWL